MQQLLAIVVSLAFGLASVQAPFLHTHEQTDPHGHGGFVHGHLQEHQHWDTQESEAGIRDVDPDDDAQTIDSFNVVMSAKVQPPLALIVASIPLEVRPKGQFIETISPRAHDPPDLGPRSARAPPI